MSTLTRLSIAVRRSRSDETSVISFCRLRFPELSVLVIEPWGDNHHSPASAAFTGFLAKHSSIYHLELGCCNRGCCLIVLDDAFITEDFLPELRIVKGHAMNIKTMASGPCQSLKKVKMLTASWFNLDGNYFSPEDVSDMFDWPNRDGVLSILESFVLMTSYDTFEDSELELFLEWMETLADRSPLLRVWRGSLPLMMNLVSGIPSPQRIHLMVLDILFDIELAYASIFKV